MPRKWGRQEIGAADLSSTQTTPPRNTRATSPTGTPVPKRVCEYWTGSERAEINKSAEELQEEWLAVLKERDDKISSLKGANKIMAECTATMRREAAEELDDAVEEIGRLKI